MQQLLALAIKPVPHDLFPLGIRGEEVIVRAGFTHGLEYAPVPCCEVFTCATMPYEDSSFPTTTHVLEKPILIIACGETIGKLNHDRRRLRRCISRMDPTEGPSILSVTVIVNTSRSDSGVLVTLYIRH